MTEKDDIRYSWKDWNWGEWTENVEHMPRALREHIRGVIDQLEGVQTYNENQPFTLGPFTKEQAEALNTSQIIQRVKGAKYILHLETNGPMDEEAAQRVKENFDEWWTAVDAQPLFLTRFPVRVECIILPEVSD